MTSRRRASLLAVVLLGLPLSACGDDGDDAAEVQAGVQEPDASVATFCERLETYADATADIDVTSLESLLASFEGAATSARALVEEAPAELREGSEAVASAAEDLIAALREANLQSLEDFADRGDAITADLEAEYGDLEPQIDELTEFAETECGIDIDE